MNNTVESSGAGRARSLAVVCLLANACAPAGEALDDAAEVAELAVQGETSNAEVAEEDDLLPVDKGGSILGAFFSGALACEGMSGVMDAWGPTSLLEWPGRMLTVTSDKPADRIPCRFRIRVSPLQGKQMAIVSVAHRGSLQLEEGSQLAMTTYFESLGKKLDPIKLIEEGPSRGNFEFERPIPPSQRVWSPCGGALDVVVTHAARIDEYAPALPANQLQLPGDAGASSFTAKVGVRRCASPG